MATLEQVVGQPRRRVEDYRLVTGGGAYVEDIIHHRADVLHVAFVRSPFPSARIRAISIAGATEADGIVAVVNGEDVGQHPGSLPLPGAPFLPGFPEAPHHPILAHEVVPSWASR
jgi:CO/xanthine dehydrogenase Mo-binding subunit